MFDSKDLQQITEHGIPQDEIERQLTFYRDGFKPVRLLRPCGVGDGLRVLSLDEREHYTKIYASTQAEGRFSKFVPASGAASRMFKDLFAYLHRLTMKDIEADENAIAEGVYPQVRKFFEELGRMAFAPALEAWLEKRSLDLSEALRARRHRTILELLLTGAGLDLASLPKGLVPFHLYPHGSRTAFEEHCVESSAYLPDADGISRLHFTISKEHEQKFQLYLRQALPRLQGKGVYFTVSLSFQDPATDSLAVDQENRPFRDEQGNLLFRPSGHGALLNNLEIAGGDLVFLQNIDNIPVATKQGEGILCKKVLGGLLLSIQSRVFSYVRELRSGELDLARLREIERFLCENFFSPVFCSQALRERELQSWILDQLDRPLRVCGMVRNQGEPGGGPFWIAGEVRPQIVESAQISSEDSEQMRLFRSATYFNPVFMACSLRNFLGKPYVLSEFSDPTSGFIAQRFHDGRELNSIERPGLWNGGMASWNTLFVEIPPETFTPVKTVLDLLKAAHQF